MFSGEVKKFKFCHCSLNQSSMDFKGNCDRILKSIKLAVDQDCSYRVGAELEVSGYGCDDHFKELDTFNHSWETIGAILKSNYSLQITVDVSMPVIHRSVAYNCRVIIAQNKIVLIRPKMHLADDGNYREKRFFVPWERPHESFDLDKYYLPKYIQELTGQEFCMFGFANLKFRDLTVGLEICEEVFRLNSHTRNSYLNCDVIFGTNGSHFQVGKISTRFKIIQEILQKSKGVYVYANAVGFDGGTMYFDGTNIVMDKTGLVQLGEVCCMKDMCCSFTVIDAEGSRKARLSDNSIMEETAVAYTIPTIPIDVYICLTKDPITKRMDYYKVDSQEKQFLDASSSYLWDYIRKSGSSGCFIPLSGGADSGVTAMIIFHMAERLLKYFKDGEPFVTSEIRRVVGQKDFSPSKPQDLVAKLLVTAYLGSKNSSEATRKRSNELAAFIGSVHYNFEIDEIVTSFEKAVKEVMELTMKFQANGGTWQEDLALQNLYSRVRMVFSYLLAQVVPIALKRPGFLLVLACGNLDESLTGYFTKYDCSSGDLNLIGSLFKVQIRSILALLYKTHGCEAINDILQAKPSAELKPVSASQTDEEDLGLTFEEIFLIATERCTFRGGLLSLYAEMKEKFPDIPDIHKKIDIFFTRYSRNRHKMVVATPTLHLTGENCAAGRFDLRPIIYADQYAYEKGMLKRIAQD